MIDQTSIFEYRSLILLCVCVCVSVYVCVCVGLLKGRLLSWADNVMPRCLNGCSFSLALILFPSAAELRYSQAEWRGRKRSITLPV